MWKTIRNTWPGRWALAGAFAVAYGTVGMGCGHSHDGGYEYDRAAYHDHDWDRHEYHHDYDHHDYDHHDYDRDRY